MIRGVAVLMGASLAATALVVALGCSSPSTVEGGSIDGSIDDAGSFDVHVVTTPDRTDATDRDIRIDASACASPCDCDGDSYSNGGPGCPSTALDCDDLDPLIHPGQSTVALVPVAPNVGDWNCDGVVTKQYGVGMCRGGVASCASSVPGLDKDAECGAPATYVTCAATSPWGGSPNCNFSMTSVVQGCR